MSNKMDRPLVTVDGRTLMDRPLEPPNFVVDTLISQGLHILAGSPKVGKSWLALWLADKHGIAILLIHHLRKETADDVFNRML